MDGFEKTNNMETEEETLEEALSSAMNANRVKAEFLESMSHDLRTPLNTIEGFTKIAASNLKDEEKVGDCLNKIAVASRYLLNIVNNILDVSYMENGKLVMRKKAFSILDMMENLATVIYSQVEKKDIRFTVECADVEDELVVGDDLRVGQMCMHILENAVKFTPMGGSVSLSLRETDRVPGMHASYEFQVRDNGIGMTEEFLDHIYDPFTRDATKETSSIEGVGLGMSVVKKLVDLMGGEISIESKLGEGTSYTVDLTFALQNRESGPSLPPELQDERVLLLFHDRKTGEAIAGWLGKEGIRAEYVVTEHDFLLRVEHGLLQQDAFSLLIMEMEQVSGLLRKIGEMAKMHGGTLPKVVLFGAQDTETEDGEWEIAVCRKPAFRSHLFTALERLYGKARMAGEEGKEFDFTGRRVLVVDDYEMNRMVTVELLKPYGILVEEATDGREAVRKIHESPEYYYDFVFMDIQMPVKNGYEATDEIRQMQREDVKTMPIVAMTANAFEEDKQLARQHGMDGHIAKPINIRLVLDVMRELLQA